ncbi:MAG: ATP-binding cassette domain-containing protein [Gemmatimonadaceae bacterium]
MIGVSGLGARVGTFQLQDVTFTVPAGQYGVVIGPAGSGKTTLLEAIAGAVAPSAGRVMLDGRDVAWERPERRRLGIVHGYLFPHLSVAENVGYGAADRGFADAMAERVGARALYDRPVRALSGGEGQLVALARALAVRPSVLLLDEPFSALDPRTRTKTRRIVRDLHRELGITVLQVTHDFTEAGLLGDVAILLDQGRVLQAASPDDVFRRPASAYIAEFLGAENVFAGVVRVLGDERAGQSGQRELEFRSGTFTLHTVGDASPGPAHAVIRAEEIVLSREANPSSARNQFTGTIDEIATLGALTRVTVDVGGVPLVAALTTRSAEELALSRGAGVQASFKAMAVHIC